MFHSALPRHPRQPVTSCATVAMTSCSAVITLCLLSISGEAMAAGTRAGTTISNTARATYTVGASTGQVDSNTNAIRVDEVLDTVVTWDNSADVPTTPGATSQVLRYHVTNSGNGAEAFALTTVSTIGGDNYDPSVTQIVIDSNGNGTYDPGTDTVYVAGSGDPVLQPDQTITVFVLSTTPGTVNDGDRGGVQLKSAAKTGTGTPGTTFSGQGEGGGNAVVGTTGADGEANGYYAVSAATVALAKSAVVADPFGGTTAVPGSIITYSIVATTAGTGTLPGLTITDAVPTGTTYIPGSITLNATGLTDAADADAGQFASGTVTVALGNVAGGQTRTVTFKVKVNN